MPYFPRGLQADRLSTVAGFIHVSVYRVMSLRYGPCGSQVAPDARPTELHFDRWKSMIWKLLDFEAQLGTFRWFFTALDSKLRR